MRAILTALFLPASALRCYNNIDINVWSNLTWEERVRGTAAGARRLAGRPCSPGSH